MPYIWGIQTTYIRPGSPILQVVGVSPCCFHLSNEKNPGWLGYIGDEILPSYIYI